MSRRTRMVVAAVVGAIVLVVGAALLLRTPELEAEPPRGQPALPDLVGMPATDLAVGIDESGTPDLFFTAEIANVGTGTFIVSAVKPIVGNWSVKQQIQHVDGGATIHDTPATMTWGGDGHDHWHVVEAARYRLESVIDGELVTLYDSKAGFCFWDSVVAVPELPERPETSVWYPHECGTRSDRRIDTGLSPGWGDRYVWTLPGQSISLTGMPPGVYRLTVEADPDRWFVETDTTNNVSVIEFALTASDGVIDDVGSSRVVEP